MRNLKKLLFICITVGVFCIGCKHANDTQAKEQNAAGYAGFYEGSYRSGDYIFSSSTEIKVLRNGKWSISIDKSGIFKGKFAGIEVSGSVDSSGNLSGVFSFADATTNISGRIEGTKISGRYYASDGNGSIRGTFTGVKAIKEDGETSLTFNNQSSKTLENITYGGKVYNQKLDPGHSCKFELDGEVNGYIFFKLHDNNSPYPDQTIYRTAEVIIIRKSEQKIFTFTNNTLTTQ